eukprot:m.1084009 g.1084009  ORF g.1084009 m.1084009 type:complete len:268 (+) comp24270_c0_seq21:500-1303(+)
MWSQQLGKDIGAAIPLWPCEHEYILTEAMPEAKNMPVIRNYDEYTYYKWDAGKVLCGFFEPTAKTAFKNEPRVPNDFSFGTFPDDLDHLEPYLLTAMHRLPLLETRGISTFFSGPESFTPDGTELIGESPDVPGLYVCAGMNSHGITCGPAAGGAVAEWIDDGGNSMTRDWFSMDIRRFPPFMAQSAFIKPRASETLGRQYKMVFPHEHCTSARGSVRQTHESYACRYSTPPPLTSHENAWLLSIPPHTTARSACRARSGVCASGGD